MDSQRGSTRLPAPTAKVPWGPGQALAQATSESLAEHSYTGVSGGGSSGTLQKLLLF